MFIFSQQSLCPKPQEKFNGGNRFCIDAFQTVTIQYKWAKQTVIQKVLSRMVKEAANTKYWYIAFQELVSDRIWWSMRAVI